MKATKKTTNGGTLLTILALFLSFFASAQGKISFLNDKPEDLIISVYIIGGVAAFGILIFVISKIASKRSEKEENSVKRPSRSISHRHHHKIIKKSA